MSQIDLRIIAKKHQEKLSKIKVAIFDVDGILTDGKIIYQDSEMGFNRFFHVRDGYGLKILRQAGIKVGIISGGKSIGLKKRLDYLGVDYQFLGLEDKREAYLEIRDKEAVGDENVLYIGDELFDIPLLKKAGFSATVKRASFEVKEVCDYICHEDGGNGVGREIVDLIRYAQDLKISVPDFD